MAKKRELIFALALTSSLLASCVGTRRQGSLSSPGEGASSSAEASSEEDSIAEDSSDVSLIDSSYAPSSSETSSDTPAASSEASSSEASSSQEPITYVFRLDKDNGPISDTAYDTSVQVEDGAIDGEGNAFPMEYCTCLAKTDHYAQLKKNAGYVQNQNPVSGLKSITVVGESAGTNQAILYFSSTTAFSSGTEITSGETVSAPSDALYFKVAAGASAYYIEYIEITYVVGGSSEDASSSSSEAGDGADDYYRFVPLVATGDTANVYDVSYVAGQGYVATVDHVINRTDDCYTFEEVAEYYMSFRTIPPNYGSSESSTVDRRWKQYYGPGTHGSSDYTSALGTFNDTSSSGEYDEFYINDEGVSFSVSGAKRLVVVVDGLNEEGYGSEPVCYMTEDHYADFKEYYGYASGWSPLFMGVENTSGSYHNVPTTSDPRVSPVTVTPAFA